MCWGWPRLLLSRAESHSDVAQAVKKQNCQDRLPETPELAAQWHFLFMSPTRVLILGTKESSGSPFGAS